ncbi:hypothetical protein QZH41_008650 [Actinostola sp. cb2023]|nr:hypothetical protein QZH41_008650 [Actinostola sp. cb2023]
MQIDDVIFYTDSKVVLGYIQNESRRFYVYVANRVQIIRKVAEPSQWKYIGTSENPADLATRCIKPLKLVESDWLTGPSFLKNPTLSQCEQEDIPLDEQDPEVRKDVSTCATRIQKPQTLGAERFSRFSSLTSLQHAIANLIVMAKEFKRRSSKISEKKPEQRSPMTTKNRLRAPTAKELQQAMTAIVRAVQEEVFRDELDIQLPIEEDEETSNSEHARKRKHVLKKSTLYRLDPFIDDDGILRVGASGSSPPQTSPPSGTTNNPIRQAGYWLIGGYHAVAKELSQSVICKKLRGSPLTQRMADLPADRIEVAPPFTNVGFDVFGPWTIQTRKMRGGAAYSKRWGLVFICLSSRAIHIEVLESMDTSSFICALRRFFAIRGPSALLRCDCGTNFVGAKSELDNALKEMNDQQKVLRYVREQGCEWVFNPPHASHFGGAWERQIGTIRRVLDAMFAELGATQLTHELLVTLMAGVCNRQRSPYNCNPYGRR